MKNRKILISSLVMILSCFILFTTATFAWFSDSVKSNNNVITAGNLDVGLKYSKNGSDWFEVKGNNELFNNNALWEPGHVEAVLLEVSNLGSLALKYSLTLDVAEVVSVSVLNDEPLKLSNHLLFGARITDFNDTSIVKDRKSALELATNKEYNQDKFDTVLEGTLTPENRVEYIQLVIAMPEEVGNEANYKTGAEVPKIEFFVNLYATQLGYEKDSFGDDYDDVKNDIPVSNVNELEKAIKEVEDGQIISLISDIEGDLIFVQRSNVEVVIEGNGYTYNGSLTIDGQSGTFLTAGLVINNVKFIADSIDTDACINLGNGTTATRYTTNVTISNCTFDVVGAVAIKTYTGGDKNLVINNCKVSNRCHSFVQLNNVNDVLIEKCEVYSKNGMNFNQSENVTIKDCKVEVRGYAVRFGEGSTSGRVYSEKYLIVNSTLFTDASEGDAAIILRGTAVDSTLTLVNTTYTSIDNKVSATIIE